MRLSSGVTGSAVLVALSTMHTIAIRRDVYADRTGRRRNPGYAVAAPGRGEDGASGRRIRISRCLHPVSGAPVPPGYELTILRGAFFDDRRTDRISVKCR
jgi:hypothetical protein